jgi:hypothetical protein
VAHTDDPSRAVLTDIEALQDLIMALSTIPISGPINGLTKTKDLSLAFDV